MILISNVRTSASNKISEMALTRTLTVSTTAFERTKEKFFGFRQAYSNVNVFKCSQAKTKAAFTRDRICSDPFGIGSTMVRIHSVSTRPVRNWDGTVSYGTDLVPDCRSDPYQIH